jgi:preprotein translocase subunit SecF
MQFFKQTTHVDFMGKRNIAMGLSIVTSLIALASLIVQGLAFGVDFTGGVIVEVGYADNADLDQVTKTLDAAGFGKVRAQNYGSTRDVLIRAMPTADKDEARQGQAMLEALKAQDPSVQLRRVEFVGPQVGSELRVQGMLAVLFAMIGILIYVALRFKWKFSVGAVVATLHDIIIIVGVFSVFQLEFDLTVLAAVLAIAGYSLNDTVVVFDRIRENFRRVRKSTPVAIVNTSVNETLSRTIMTSFVTLIVVLAMFLVGGEVIHNFSLALIIGIGVGTYSSIYIASALALLLKVTPADVIETEIKRTEMDALP